MFEAIALFVAKGIAGYALSKGLDWITPKNKQDFTTRLQNIIRKANES